MSTKGLIRAPWVGPRLVALRGKRELKEIAAGTGFPLKTLERWESGQTTTFRVKNLQRMARFHGVTLESLIAQDATQDIQDISRTPLPEGQEGRKSPVPANWHTVYATLVFRQVIKNGRRIVEDAEEAITQLSATQGPPDTISPKEGDGLYADAERLPRRAPKKRGHRRPPPKPRPQKPPKQRPDEAASGG
jgi:hypothetical protein